MQSKKWHVLIVDDEFRIGTLIKKLIHWDELNLDCMAVVDNGGTAFEIIQSESCPNVVITDIRMPKIDGLELIIMTKELQKDMKFIVISGYKEFEYAHQALKYGVEDYLLKPVSEDELNHVLKKISEELSASWQSEQEQRAFKETVSESRHIIKRDFLKNIIETEEPEVVDDRVEFQGEIYRGIDIKLDYVDYNKKDKKQDKLTTSRIEEIVERILKTETEEVLICEKENLHIYCLFNYDFSKSMLMSMGGASGVIFGSLYLAGAKGMDPKSVITSKDLADMEKKSLEAIQERGGAQVGDKTMVDALSPAVDALAANADKGLLEMLKAAEESAKQGVEDTKKYVAKFGRAKSLLERAIGHQDAGATSVYLIFQGMREFVEGKLA